MANSGPCENGSVKRVVMINGADSIAKHVKLVAYCRPIVDFRNYKKAKRLTLMDRSPQSIKITMK